VQVISKSRIVTTVIGANRVLNSDGGNTLFDPNALADDSSGNLYDSDFSPGNWSSFHPQARYSIPGWRRSSRPGSRRRRRLCPRGGLRGLCPSTASLADLLSPIVLRAQFGSW
jgi:hypothetical protein